MRILPAAVLERLLGDGQVVLRPLLVVRLPAREAVGAVVVGQEAELGGIVALQPRRVGRAQVRDVLVLGRVALRNVGFHGARRERGDGTERPVVLVGARLLHHRDEVEVRVVLGDEAVVVERVDREPIDAPRLTRGLVARGRDPVHDDLVPLGPRLGVRRLEARVVVQEALVALLDCLSPLRLGHADGPLHGVGRVERGDLRGVVGVRDHRRDRGRFEIGERRLRRGRGRCGYGRGGRVDRSGRGGRRRRRLNRRLLVGGSTTRDDETKDERRSNRSHPHIQLHLLFVGSAPDATAEVETAGDRLLSRSPSRP